MTEEEQKLPNICTRCYEEIKDGDEIELMSFIPRWGMSVEVHKGCKHKKVPLQWFKMDIEPDEEK